MKAKIIKNKLLNSQFGKITVEPINNKKIKQLSNEIINSENEEINEILIKFGFNSNLKNLQYNNTSDFLFLDNIFDTYIISKFKDLKLPKKCKKAQENFVEYMIDIKNIKNILRAKNLEFDEKTCDKLFLGEGKEISNWKFNELCQLIDVNQVIINLEGTSYYDSLKDSIEKFNAEKTTQVFEKSLDEYFIKILKDLSIENYVHIGPILRFLISKKFEIINLKIISKAIEENIDSQLIKNNLIMEINQ